MLTGTPQIFELNPYEQHTEQMHPLGMKATAGNGDIYRYTKLDADVAAGYLLVAPGKIALHQNLAVAVANVVGDKKVVLDVGAAAIVAGTYDGGTLVFNDNSPEGEWYTITNHEANAGSLETDIFIVPGIKTATVVDSSQACLIKNPWNLPVVSQLIAERAAGVTVQDWDVSANEYGWLKTRGMSALLADTTGWTKGYTLAISDQVNGAGGVNDGGATMVVIGQGIDTGTAGEFNAVYLTID